MLPASARRAALGIVLTSCVAGALLVATSHTADDAAPLDGGAAAVAGAPRAEDAGLTLTPPPRTLDDLRAWAFLDLARDGSARLALLASRAPIAADRYETTPDGRRVHAREVRVASIEGGVVRSARLDLVALMMEETLANGDAAMSVSLTEVRAFVNYRAHGRPGWGFDGAIYRVARPDLALVEKRGLYQDENRGSYPFFEGDVLVHYAHDGYRLYHDGVRLERVDPAQAAFRYIERLRARTDGMLPGPSDEVVRRLAAGW